MCWTVSVVYPEHLEDLAPIRVRIKTSSKATFSMTLGVTNHDPGHSFGCSGFGPHKIIDHDVGGCYNQYSIANIATGSFAIHCCP